MDEQRISLRRRDRRRRHRTADAAVATGGRRPRWCTRTRPRIAAASVACRDNERVDAMAATLEKVTPMIESLQ